MAYTPTVPSTSPDTGPEYIYQELLRVAEALQMVEDGLALPIRHVPPKKYREGQLVIADGTDWNPGGGKAYMSTEMEAGLSYRLLTPDECLDRCSELAPFIEPAFAHAGGEIDGWSAIRRCAMGHAACFLGDDNGKLIALLIVEILDFPLKRVCNVLGYAGEARKFYYMQGEIEEWARRNGAVEIRGYGGEGACRLARRHGYSEVYRMYAKPL